MQTKGGPGKHHNLTKKKDFFWVSSETQPA